MLFASRLDSFFGGSGLHDYLVEGEDDQTSSHGR